MKSPVSNLPKIDFGALPTSAWWLIAANVVPLLGVILFGWRAFDVVFIYWLENVMLGGINLLRMFTCAPDTEDVLEKRLESDDLDGQARAMLEKWKGKSGTLGAAHHAAKLFFMPFFTVHYGMFCFVHGVFVFVLLSDDGPFGGGRGFEGGGDFDPFNMPQTISSTLTASHLWWAVLGLFASHMYSFFRNYLGNGEFRRVLLPELMVRPYGRIVILHVALLFGAFAITALGSPVILLMILIVGKTILDLKLHLREHQSLEEREVTSGVVPDLL